MSRTIIPQHAKMPDMRIQKKYRKKKGKSPKEKAWETMSRYVRLRDAIKYCKTYGVALRQFIRPEDIIGKCCTCGSVKAWIRMDAGHWKSRGTGGGSGVYFDERNVNLQCKSCNGFEGGRQKEHEEYIFDIYGQIVIDELELKHHTRQDFSDFVMIAMEQFYKEKYQELLRKNGLK